MKNHIQKIENTYADCNFCEDDETVFLANGTVIFNKYEIISLLGYGGMGQVYLAKDLHLGRLVAVKTLYVENDYNIESRNRFLREAKMAAAVNHPNVLTIYEAGFEGNKPFLVMEYVEGQTLRKLVNSSQMNLGLALNLAIQLAQGLLAMHSTGIIHRDLKLDNFILREDGYLKILDFGLAKSTNEKNVNKKFETRIGVVLGTPRYMSPEQARGQELDNRSDIFSFGSVVYELLTGNLAFDAEDDMQALYQVVFSQVTKMPDSIPTKICKIVEKTMEKKAIARPQSMQEVLDILLEIRDTMPLAIGKNETSYLFANTFIAPIVKRVNQIELEEVKEKKLELKTSTQTSPIVSDYEESKTEFEVKSDSDFESCLNYSDGKFEIASSKIKTSFLTPLYEFPISHVVGLSRLSGSAKSNNSFFKNNFYHQNLSPKPLQPLGFSYKQRNSFQGGSYKTVNFPTLKAIVG